MKRDHRSSSTNGAVLRGADAATLRRLRQAALADPEGQTLDRAMAQAAE